MLLQRFGTRCAVLSVRPSTVKRLQNFTIRMESKITFGRQKQRYLSATRTKSFVQHERPRRVPSYAPLVSGLSVLFTGYIVFELHKILHADNEKENSHMHESVGKEDFSETVSAIKVIDDDKEIKSDKDINEERQEEMENVDENNGSLVPGVVEEESFEDLRWPRFTKLKVLTNKPLNGSNSVHILRICLENKDDTLGLKPGNLIQLRGLSNEVSENFPFGKLFIRSFVPVSWPDKQGHFDIIYKFHDEPEGEMADYLHSLRRGDEVDVRSVDRKIGGNYPETKDTGAKWNVGLIAAGSGLTAMLQLLRYHIRQSTNFKFSLIVSDCSQHDMFYVKELIKLEDKFPNQLTVIRTLSRDYPINWNQGIGRVTKEFVEDHVDIENVDTIFVCGPDGFVEHLCGKHASKNVHFQPGLVHDPLVLKPVKQLGGILSQLEPRAEVIVF
mmetsp:Transcript_12209/g.14802  ORF Transcript_12209/g.14802 Transcript_12209/m.14802 type:complete len:443 (-) Transcript_12209:1587-2915(-)